MLEETAGAETPAAEGAQPEATDANPESSTEQQPDAENEGEASAPEPTGDKSGDDAAAEKPRKKHWAHDRIDELTRQRREAERQAEYWRARAEAKSSDLDSLDYEEQIAERVSARQRKEMADSAADAVRSVAQQVFEARESLIRERYTDYDTVARNPAVQITPSMAEVIFDSEHGPELAYHLGKNPAEAAKIAALPAIRQAAELGRLEAKISAPKAQPKQPPAPVQPVSAIAAGGQKAPGEMSMSEYIKWREANP
jgi:hypothetical protein